MGQYNHASTAACPLSSDAAIRCCKVITALLLLLLPQSKTIDVPGTAQHLRYFAGFCDKIEGEFVSHVYSSKQGAYAE